MLSTPILLVLQWLAGIALGYWSLQLFALLLWAQLLFLALPRIVRSYRGFRLSLISPMEQAVPLTQPNKIVILGFFAPRYVLGSIVFGFVLSPVNILWGIMQLPYGAFITTNFAVLATGTLCIRMMVGHAFKNFTLRVDR